SFLAWRGVQHRLNRFGHRGVVADRDERAIAAMLQNLPRATGAIGTDDRTATGHGLYEYTWKPFEGGRKDEDRGACHIGKGVFLKSRQCEILADAMRICQLLQFSSLISLTEDHQPDWSRGVDSGKGPNQRHKVFLGDEAANAEDY